MKKIILLLFLVPFTHVFAQEFEIKGKVIDEVSHKPIEFVNAIVMKNDSIYNGSVTDSLGVFSISVSKGVYTLKLQQFGETLSNNTINVLEDTDVGEININQSVMLDEIVIEADREIIKQEGDKLLFDVENSPFAIGNSADELLSKTPKVTSNGGAGFKIKNKSALILVNGRKTNVSGESLQAYLSTINSEDIKRIEVQETADASQEGSTKNGVINIVLKSNPKGFRIISKQYMKYYTKENQKYSSNWNTQYGSDKFYLYANFNFNKERTAINSFTDFHYKDGTRQLSESDNTINRQKYINANIGGSYYINPNNELSLAYTSNSWNNDYETPNKLTLTRPNESPIISNGLGNTDMLIKNEYLQFNYTLKLDDKGSDFKILSDFGINKLDNDIEVDTHYPKLPARDNHILINGFSKSKYFSGQVDYNQFLEDDWKLLAGVKFNDVHRDNDQRNYIYENQDWVSTPDKNQDFTNKEKIYASYLSGSKQWEKQYLKLGIRMEHTRMLGHNNIDNKETEKHYTDWFPSVYYKYDFNKDLSVNMNYRNSINRPRFADLTPYTIKDNDYQYTKGNPNLTPYYTNTYKLGIDFKRHSLTLSYQNTDDYIRDAYETDENKINIVKPINSGVEDLWGADYSFNKNFNKWFYLNVSAGVSYAKYDLPNGHFEGTNAYENIFARFTLPDDWSFGVIQEYKTNQVNFTEAYKYNTYTSVYARKTFLDNSLIVFLRLSDIFNTSRTDVMSYHSDFNYQFYMKPSTRNLTFMVQYTLDNKKKIKTDTIESSDENRGRL